MLELPQCFYVLTEQGIPLLTSSCQTARLSPQMRTLATQIKRELRESALPIPYCAIYEEELQRFWPSELENREAQIEKFAKQYGLKLRFYKRGLCAIFQEDV